MTQAEKILKDLVAFPVLGGESNLAIIDYIENYLTKRNITSYRVYNEERTKASLHARIGPAADGGIILSGHTDVVPVAGQAWTTVPFALTAKEDKLYARGSADMKGFIACCLANAEYYRDAELRKPVYFAFSYDEEIGCLAGDELAEAISGHYQEKPAGAIIGEPTLMIPVTGQKGIAIQQTVVTGSEGHSSRIAQEVSAIHEAVKLIAWLDNKMRDLATNSQQDYRFEPAHTTIHVGKINGGIAPNVIADKCSFSWDVRTIPADSLEEIQEEFYAYCRTLEEQNRKVFPGFSIEHEPLHPPVPGLNTPGDHWLVQLAKDLSGIQETDAVSYASEAGQFANAGFPAVICGPGSIDQAHRADEFIAKDQLDKGVEFHRHLASHLSELPKNSETELQKAVNS